MFQIFAPDLEPFSASIDGILPSSLLTLGRVDASITLLSLNRSLRTILTSRNFVASKP